MRHIVKRGFSMLLVLAMILSLFTGVTLTASAAQPTSAAEVSYVTSGQYVYNWGKRDTVATFLTTYAQKYYTGNYTYEKLSSLSGNSSTDTSFYSSAMGTAIHNMLVDKQTYTNSYEANKTLLAYTECEESSKTQISSYYSGTSMGSTWGSGWNREHTWPNSKGLGSNDENDVMMIKPTLVSENTSRGNTAYGESSGFFDPNGNGKSMHGDVARLMLQHLMRWGNTSYFYGSSGVMESRAVLLKWMEEDPVDTWEMGRNDAVQQITGVRNVFVDYPELAFLLLGASVPANYTTPSGGSGSGGTVTPAEEHTVSFSVPNGVTKPSAITGSSVTLPTPTGTPTGSYTYTFKGWVTSTVDNVTGKPATIYEAGTSFAPAADMTLYALYTYSVGGTGSSSTYNKITTEAELTDGASYVFASSLTGTAMSNTVSSNWVKTGGTYSGDSIEPADTDVWTVSSGVISCSGGNLYSSGAKAVSLSTSSTTWTFTVSGDAWTIASGSNVLSYNASGGWRPYSGGYGSDKSFYIYKGGSGGTTYYTTVIGAACAHTNTTTTTVDATCTAAGSVTETCDDCGAILSSTTLPMLSHNWVAGNIVAPTCTAQGYTVYTCSLCGDTKNDDYTDMIAHTSVTDAAVAATCTATGLTEGSHCSVCGTVITAQETVKALGHSWDAGTVTQEPTETQDGVKTYICTRCSETKTEIIPALGSTFVISFSVPNGVTAVDSISYNTNDASITLPTAEAPDGYTFLGWSASAVDSVTDRPDVLTGAYTPTSSQTLYALYSYSVSDEGGAVAGSFTLVTSAPADWSGEYVLTSADAAKVLLTDGTNPNTTAAAVTLADTGMTLSGNTLSGVTDKYILVAEKVGDYYSLRLKGSTDTKYLMTSNSNSGFNTAAANTATTAQWTISLSSGAAVIKNASYTSRTIRYNSNSAQFRTYTSGQSAVYLYAGSASTTYYTTVIGDACQHSNVTHTQAVEATCTAAGNIEYWYCADCGRYFSDAECTAAITLSSTVVAATGHSYSSETTTAATCTTDGVTTYTCANCGDTYTEAIPAPGHSWDEGKVTTEPTATVDGVMTYTCTVCGATRTEAIPALGEKVRYSRVTEITSGTEYIMVFCCGGTYYAIGTDLSPVAVTVENDVISLKKGEAPLWTLTATAANDGYTITNAGKYLYANSTDTKLSTGNTAATWTAAQGTESVCDANTFHIGVGTSRALGIYGTTSTIKHYSLSNETNTGASYEFDIYLFANTCAHTNTELQGYVAATCTTNGYTGDEVCLNCGAVVTTGTTILQGHDYVEASRTEATCTAVGNIHYECSRCDSTKDETIAALGHNYGQTAHQDATCTADGYTTYTCSNCNDSYTDIIPAIGHNYDPETGICGNCGDQLASFTVNFTVPEGIDAINPISAFDGTKITLPTPTGTLLANAEDYVFAGWIAEDVVDATNVDFFEAGEYSVTGNVTLKALYTWVGSESYGNAGVYQLLTEDALSSLDTGWMLLITNDGKWQSMTKALADYTSGSNDKFASEAVTVSNNTITLNASSAVQEFTVVKDAASGYFYLISSYTDSENNDYYLTSCTNTASANNITLTTAPTAAALWAISYHADGTVKLTAQGSYTANTVQFNSSNYNGFFSCYGETYYGSDTMPSNIYGIRLFASNPVYHFTTEPVKNCEHQNVTWADNGDGTCSCTCDDCGHIVVDHQAHSWKLAPDAEGNVAATCTETGKEVYVCENCAGTKTETTDALGHDYAGVETTAPTCTAEGVMTYTCTRCDDSYTEAIPTTDHSFGDDGVCTSCGAYKYVKVTEAPANWEGEYLVVYAASDGAYVFDGKNDASGNYTIGTYYGEGTDTICVANPDAYQIMVEPNGASYNIMNANADWFSYSSAKNGFSVGSTAADYTFVMVADGSVAITNAGGYSVKFNTSSKQFRFYGSSISTKVYLYEKFGTCHHDWVLDAAASTAATCTTSGQNVYKCSLCGVTKVETIAALGHDYQYNTVAPTCTEQGYTEVTCANCDYNDLMSFVDALGHDFSIEPETTDAEHYIAPTATEEGLMYCQCSRCGEWSTEGVIIPALGVVTTTTYTMWTVDDFGGEYADTFKNVEQFIIVAESNGTYYAMSATADGSNLKAVPVTLDGDTIAVASDSGIVPMIPDYEATDYNGTTTGLGFKDAEGKYLHLNSSNMNFNTTAQNGLFTVSKAYTNSTFCLYADATANYIAFDAVNTCFTVAGSKSADASIYIFVADHITITNNDVAVSALTLAANAEGTFGYILNLPIENQSAIWSCDNEDALVVDSATGAYLAGTSGTANVTVTVSTYASDGYSNYKEYTATIPVTVGEHTHSYTETVVAPTCETAGYTLHTCSCGDSYQDNEIAALGHLWDEGTVTTEPTCVDAGVKTYSCSRCGGSKTENIPALGHTPVEEVLTAATCTQDGQKEIYCSVCNEHISFETIPATGHTIEEVAAVEATCTTDGNNAYYKCSVCGAFFSDAEGTTALDAIPTVSATGHSLDLIDAVAATCTTDGNDAYYKCSVCGALFFDAEGTTALDAIPTVPATGHTEVTDAAVAPTCTTTGLTEGSHCSVCNEVIVAQTEVAALGHSYTYVDNGNGTHTATCSVCKDTVTADHTFVDGACVCGAVESTDPIVDNNLKFTNHSLTLGDSIAINFVIKTSYLTYDSYRIVIEKDKFDTDGNVIGTETYEFTSFEVYNATYSKVVFSNLIATEMGTMIRATIYGTKDGVVYTGGTDTYSVATYALNQLNKTSADEKLKTLCADLLNYGAAAQIYKVYNTANLVNAQMSDGHAVYASDFHELSLENIASRVNNADATLTWAGNSLDMQSKVEMLFVFNVPAGSDLSKISVTTSYTDPKLGKIEKTYSGDEIQLYSTNRYKVTVDTLYSYDMSVPVTAVLYYDGVEQGTAVYSIESYAKSSDKYLNGTPLGNCVGAMLQYGYSAVAYFGY